MLDTPPAMVYRRTTGRERPDKGKGKMQTVTISAKTAERLLHRMADWLEYIETLDAETRADVVALDELINAMPEGNSHMAAIEEQQRLDHLAAMERAAQYRAEQAEKAAKND